TSAQLHEEGVYGNGSYALSCIASTSQGLSTSTAEEVDIASSGGQAVLTQTVGQSTDVTLTADPTASGTQGQSTTTSTDTILFAGDSVLTSTVQSSDSSTLHQEGTLANFSVALACVLLRDTSNVSASATEAGHSSDQDPQTSTSSGTSAGSDTIDDGSV